MRRAIDAPSRSSTARVAIWLGAQKYLERFYESFGFVRDGERLRRGRHPAPAHAAARRIGIDPAYDAGRRRLCCGCAWGSCCSCRRWRWRRRRRRKRIPKKQVAEQTARGDAWAVAGRCDEAVKAYRQALVLQPKNPVVQVRLAHCLAKSGGAGEAKQMLHGARRRAGRDRPAGAAGARRPGAAVGRLRRRRRRLRQAARQIAVERRRAHGAPRRVEGPQRRGRRQGAGARPRARQEDEDRAQGGRDAAAPRRGAGRDVHLRRCRQGPLRRQAHAGDGASQGRGHRARARRRQARRSRGGAVPARARLRQSRGRQEG